MKKYVRLLIITAVIAPFLASNIAMAETGSGSTTSSNSGRSTASTESPAATSTTQSSDDAPLTEQQKTELTKRLSDRKTELKTKLSALESTKIKSKCTTSQGVISSLGQRVKGIETSHTEVYGNLVDRLTKLSTKLKDKGVDTTTLNSEITTLKAKIATFTTDLTAYKQTVKDLKTMDCVSDPTAFKASLETARTAREKVSKDATDIRTYLTVTIKPTLKELRSKVEAKASSDSSGSSGSTTNSGAPN